jgi:alpha-D-ribose 1-methylphosphonate 5-triphosphate synthase subunit PhnG
MREPGLCEILAEADGEVLASLLDLIPDEVEIVRPPREGLVLMTCREPLGDSFHLGEVLVAECQVRFRGTTGHAMVVGGDERQALAAATVDALRSHPRPHPVLPPMEELVADVRARMLARRYQEARLAAATRVEFDLLPGD